MSCFILKGSFFKSTWLHENFICCLANISRSHKIWQSENHANLAARNKYKNNFLQLGEGVLGVLLSVARDTFMLMSATSEPLVQDRDCLATGAIRWQQSLWLTGFLCIWFWFNNTPKLWFFCLYAVEIVWCLKTNPLCSILPLVS